MFRNPFNWYNKFGTIPSEYREAMSYEEQILWLCQQINELKSQTGNFNYNLLINKPSINGITLEGDLTSGDLDINTNYSILTNKPSINSVTLIGNKSLDDLGIQGKLIAGSGIRIVGNTISATGGGGGGTSDYEDLDNKPSINSEVLIGDSSAYDLKLQNMLVTDLTYMLEEHTGKIANFNDWQLNHILPQEVPESGIENGSYVVLDVYKGERINFSGICELYKFSENNQLSYTYSTYPDFDDSYFDNTTNGKIVINYFSTNTYTPKLEKIESGESISGEDNNLKKEINYINEDLGLFLDLNFPYKEYPQASFSTGHAFAINKTQVGEVLPSYIPDTNGRYTKMPINNLLGIRNFGTNWVITGNTNGIPLYFTTKEDNGIEYITSVSDLNIQYPSNTGVAIEYPEEATYLYIQFNETNILTPALYYQKIEEIKASPEIHVMQSNLTIQNSPTPTLETGYYYTNGYFVYLFDNSEDALKMYGDHEMFYFDADSKAFIGSLVTLTYSGGSYSLNHPAYVLSEIKEHSSYDNKLITNGAFKDATFYKTLSAVVFNMDGTNSGNLTTGYYWVKNNVSYYANNNLEVLGNNSLYYYDSSANELKLIINKDNDPWNAFYFIKVLTYVSENAGWTVDSFHSSQLVYESSVVSAITPSTSGNAIPNVTAVKDYTLEKYSTSEKVVGTWTNGKPLYEKTYFLTSIPQVTTDGTAVTVLNDISSLSADYGFIFTAFTQSASGNNCNFQTLPYINNAGRQLKTQISRDNTGNLYQLSVISNGTAFNSYYQVVITIRYTKSTD